MPAVCVHPPNPRKKAFKSGPFSDARFHAHRPRPQGSGNKTLDAREGTPSDTDRNNNVKAPPGDDNKGTAGFQPLSQRYKNTYDTPKWPARTSNNMALSKAKGTLCSQGVNRRRDSHSGSTCTTWAMSTTVPVRSSPTWHWWWHNGQRDYPICQPPSWKQFVATTGGGGFALAGARCTSKLSSCCCCYWWSFDIRNLAFFPSGAFSSPFSQLVHHLLRLIGRGVHKRRVTTIRLQVGPGLIEGGAV